MEYAKYLQPILQTDRRLPAAIGRWGCLMMSCFALPQFRLKMQFSSEDIITMYEKGFSANVFKRGTDPGEFNIASIEDAITMAFRFAGATHTAYHIGNRTEYLGYATPHRTDYTMLKGRTGKGGPHWKLGDEYGEQMYDPDPSLGVILQDDCHMLRIRIER